MRILLILDRNSLKTVTDPIGIPGGGAWVLLPLTLSPFFSFRSQLKTLQQPQKKKKKRRERMMTKDEGRDEEEEKRRRKKKKKSRERKLIKGTWPWPEFSLFRWLGPFPLIYAFELIRGKG